MADLTGIQASQSVKIVGNDSTGAETNPVNADVNGNLQTKDYADGPVTPGTVAAASILIGGQFNTTLPTLTNTQQASSQLDNRGRLITSVNAASGTLTDRSGTATTTSTQMMAANASRRYLFIQNVSTTKTIWFNFTTAAVATFPSITLPPGASFVMESSFISTEAIFVINGSAGTTTFSAKEG